MTRDGQLSRDKLKTRLHDSVCENAAGNVVLAGPWGSGKTTLLNELVDGLNADESEFHVVTFSAWAVGSGDDPTAVLLRRLVDAFNRVDDGILSKMDAKQSAALRKAAKELVSDLAAAFGTKLVGALTKFTLALFAARKQARSEQQTLRDGLASIARGVAEAAGKKRVLLIVDDLDRVTPEEGIQFLDSMFHLFLDPPDRPVGSESSGVGDWPISSVWAVNMTVLEEALYERYRLQPSFDATAYLAKIFHRRIDVPPVFATHRHGASEVEGATLDGQGSAVLWEYSLRGLFDGASSWTLAVELSDNLNYNQLGNLRMHRMVRDTCVEYWHSLESGARRQRIEDPTTAVRDARLIALTHAFPGFRETVAIYKRWDEFVARINERRTRPSFEPARAFQWKFVDAPGLWALLTDLEAIEWKVFDDSDEGAFGRGRACVGHGAEHVSDDLAKMLLQAF